MARSIKGEVLENRGHCKGVVNQHGGVQFIEFTRKNKTTTGRRRKESENAGQE